MLSFYFYRFYFNDEVDSDSESDSSQLVHNSFGRTAGQGPIHPDCLPAANENFNCFQRTSPLTTISSVEAPIHQFIATCINSKEDPKCSQEFYALIHRQLYIAMRHNLISSPSELDDYWVKFDNWATNAYRRNVIQSPDPDHREMYLEQIKIANDPTINPPNPTESHEQQTPQHFYRISSTNAYQKKIIGRMETFVHKLISSVPRSTSDNTNAVRNDIRSRVKFYLKWRSYNYQTYKTFLDHYWNIFLNRRADYYKSHPLPDHLFLKEPQQQRKKIRNFKTVGNEVLRRKKFQRERLIKNCINECIDLGIDPRKTHKFHWTIHRILQAVYGECPENRISLNEMLRIWKKFDEMAVKAFLDKEKFTIFPAKGNGEYYEEATELPPPPTPQRLVKLQKLKGPEMNELLSRNLKEFVLKYGGGDNGDINPILGNVEIRREFLMRYVGQLEEVVENKEIDLFWNELGTQTCNKYEGWRRMKEEQKEKADKLIDRSQRGRVRKGVNRFVDEFNNKSPQGAKRLSGGNGGKRRGSGGGGGPPGNLYDARARLSLSSTERASSREIKSWRDEVPVPAKKKFITKNSIEKRDFQGLSTDDDDECGLEIAPTSPTMASSTSTMNASSGTMTKCGSLSSTVAKSPGSTSTINLTAASATMSASLHVTPPKLAPVPQPVKTDTPPVPEMALMGVVQGEFAMEISSAKQREFFLNFMSCLSNKCVVKVQMKNELLTD